MEMFLSTWNSADRSASRNHMGRTGYRPEDEKANAPPGRPR